MTQLTGWDHPPGWDDVPELPQGWQWAPVDPDEAPWPTEEELFLQVAELHERVAGLTRQAAAGPVAAPGVAEAWRLDDAELLAELVAAQRAVARAQARWLQLVGEAERRGVVVREHGMPVASWLAAGTSHSSRAARAEVRLANQLGQFGHVATALGSGGLSLEQATILCHGLDTLPDRLDAAQRDAVEEHLVELAGEFGPSALRRLVNHAVDVVAPEVGEEHALKALERAEREQQRARHVGWRTDGDDGSLRFWGKLPAAEGALFKQHLSAVASAQRVADTLMGVDTTQAQALADALALAVGHHATCAGGPVKGGDHTRVIVTMGLDDLRSGIGTGTLVESDEPITAGQARRIACSAGILPLVLDGHSIPLDLGRGQRFFTPHQRIALAVRDGGCAFPGCDRPPADCDAHHGLDPWHAGGRTDVADGVLLCPHHHHLVEPDPNKAPERNWKITFDDRGKAIFQSPVHRTGQRIVKQHHRYRT